MARPTKYSPSYSFNGFQTQYPTSPMPAPRLDEQFNDIAQSLGQSIDAVNDIRRDDGKLKNGIVTPESLAASLNIGFTMAGQWQVGQSYDAGDGVVHNQKFYVALVANTATLANAPDADGATWGYLFSVDDLVVAGALSIPVVAGVGDGTTKTFALPVAPASVNNVFAKVGVNVLSVNAYTVSGASITLATAPAIGVAYEFRILSTIAVTELEQAVYDARDTAVAKAAEAAASASAAAGSASAAAGSASSAASSASSASASKTDAAASASAAAGSVSAAATSATNASGSATSAGNSATAAAGSASAASTSATNASNSATSAASSQTAAANSASSASTSASNALASENAAEDAADRAEAAAAGVEFPVSYEPQSLTAAQQGQAQANIGAGILAGFRNKIINPDFDVWQRGSTQDNTQNGIASADRWSNERSSGCVRTTSRQELALGFEGVAGSPKYYLRTSITNSGGAADKIVLTRQRIEGVRTLAGKKATLTFYARADAVKNMSFDFQQTFGTQGVDGIAATKVTLGTAFQKYSFVVDIPSIASATIDTANDHLTLAFWFSAGANYNARTQSLGLQTGTFDIAHVSLVEGDATKEDDPISLRHPQQELALCQRYYQRIEVQGTTYSNGPGFGYQMPLPLPVQMRSTPTDTVIAAGTFTGNMASISTVTSIRKALVLMNANGAGLLGVYNREHALDAEI